MSVVLNERDWAERAIENRELGNKPGTTLSRVARYYRQHEKYSRGETSNKLERFLLLCDPKASIVKWGNTLERIVRDADKYPLINVDGVLATKSEMEIIDGLEARQTRRLAFALLCLAKYWNSVRQNNDGWVDTPDKDIMRMANINTSIKRQSQMLHKLKELNLVRFSRRVDNLNLRVIFMNDDSPAALFISDFRNLGNQYMLYCGEKYIQCSQCGLTIKVKSNVQKYCVECAAEMYIKQSVESVMRQRKSSIKQWR